MTRGTIRPGGRTERVRQIVADTVLQLIKDGSSEFTMLEVAERSGVARSTLYARWPTREALIAEALREHNAIFQVEPREDWREHLHAIAIAFRDFSSRPDEIAINGMNAHLGPGFINEETHRQWMSISDRIVQPLRAAQAAGHIRPDIDAIMVISTLFITIAGLIGFAKDTPSDEYLIQLVDLLISGCEVRNEQGR